MRTAAWQMPVASLASLRMPPTRWTALSPRSVRWWIRATRLVGVVSIPALVGLVIVAPDFVAVVLGPRWVDATPVIQILALVGLVQSLQSLCGEVLLALGRANWLLRFTALWFVASIASFAIGVRWGVVGVAAGYAVATMVVEPLRTAETLGADACDRLVQQCLDCGLDRVGQLVAGRGEELDAIVLVGIV